MKFYYHLNALHANYAALLTSLTTLHQAENSYTNVRNSQTKYMETGNRDNLAGTQSIVSVSLAADPSISNAAIIGMYTEAQAASLPCVVNPDLW